MLCLFRGGGWTGSVLRRAKNASPFGTVERFHPWLGWPLDWPNTEKRRPEPGSQTIRRGGVTVARGRYRDIGGQAHWFRESTFYSMSQRKRANNGVGRNVHERLVNNINRNVKLGNGLNSKAVRPRLIYSSKRTGVFGGSKLLVDFLHIQYLNFMPHWSATVKHVPYSTAPPQLFFCLTVTKESHWDAYDLHILLSYIIEKCAYTGTYFTYKVYLHASIFTFWKRMLLNTIYRKDDVYIGLLLCYFLTA